MGQRATQSPEAEPLLRLANDWDLVLHIPFGEPTRIGQRASDRDGTIDHAWASRELNVTYLEAEDLVGSDHIPQAIIVDEAPAKRKLWFESFEFCCKMRIIEPIYTSSRRDQFF
ncbi:hypothetical protein V8F33_010489 [Rhypophila sp. PSN 637]